MANVIIPPKWAVPARETTPEDIFLNRREFIRKTGLASIALGGAVAGMPMSAGAQPDPNQPKPAEGLYPAKCNEKYKLDRPLTDEKVAASNNNFYEFANSANGRGYQQMVAGLSKGYTTRPWEVEIGGLVESPRTMTIDEIEQVAPLEERLYRFRCVERWAMAVPWIGYSFSKLIEAVKPKPEAKYVRFVTFLDKSLPGVQKAHWYPWPYYEGLRMDEALNELTLLCTGIYGHELPPQHGAPVRIIAPWKYGYKSPKSIVKIEFVAEQPPTFWNDLQPKEYGFLSNVEPHVPHPRWSQAMEYMIPDGEPRPTLLYNGYQEYVSNLYS